MSLTLCDIIEDESVASAEVTQVIHHLVTDTCTHSAEAAPSVFFTLLVDAVADETAVPTVWVVAEDNAVAEERLFTVYPSNTLVDTALCAEEARGFLQLSDAVSDDAIEQSNAFERVSNTVLTANALSVEEVFGTVQSTTTVVDTAAHSASATSSFRNTAVVDVASEESVYVTTRSVAIDTARALNDVTAYAVTSTTVASTGTAVEQVVHRIRDVVEAEAQADASAQGAFDDVATATADASAYDAVVVTTETAAYTSAEVCTYVYDTVDVTLQEASTVSAVITDNATAAVTADETAQHLFIHLVLFTAYAEESTALSTTAVDEVEALATVYNRVLVDNTVSAWVMNPATSAMSMLTGMQFDGIAGDYFTRDGSLWKFSDTQYAAAMVRTGFMSFKETAKKRFESVQFYPEAIGIDTVAIRTYEGDEYSYTPTGDRVILGRGLRSHSIQMTVYTMGRSNIDAALIDVALTSRRV